MDEKETHVGKREREEEVHSAETRKGRRPTAEGDVVRIVSDKNSLHARWPTDSVPTTVARVHAS